MTYILPVTLAIFTYYSQKMIMTDPQQKIILYLSPLLILFFGFKLPSGVLLYWATSTVLSTMQQVLVTRSSETSLAK
jgi:YidC/Oxa1 family membrane protein insertase